MKYFLPIIFLVVAGACLWLLFGPSPFASSREAASPQIRVVSPQAGKEATKGGDASVAERMAYEDDTVAKVALDEGEVAVTVITQDFDADAQDEQIIAFRRTAESEGPIYLTYAAFDQNLGGYRRMWTAATAATRPRTFSLFVKDLIGDRSTCVVATGLNGAGEQTMTVFRTLPSAAGEPFERIAELRIEGSTAVLERERSQAYHLGQAAGESFRIATYGRDFESANLLDQIETIYTFDPVTRRYERTGTARVPGTQIEQRRVRELLDGTPAKFERFLDGLWYFSPEGNPTGERQYLLFDPQRRELVFYADDTQEVFGWLNSSATRYGLYLTTQNISITTLRRLVDIELESVDAIRVKVFEDVRLKIGIGGRWDGTYRKVPVESKGAPSQSHPKARLDAEYEGAAGRLRFLADGRYELEAEGAAKRGNYAFFEIDGIEVLELRPEGGGTAGRSTYRVSRTARGGPSVVEELNLRKIRLGVRGLEELHEGDLVFTSVARDASAGR